MAFPELWMRELLGKNDIVSVISEYTHLAPKGGRMWGLCPFHPERDASFTVSPDKQLYHCFSCKSGGSVIQFIMQAESLSFAEAVRFLAQRVNMNMPEEIDDEKLLREKAFRDRLYKANREAALFYHNMLRSPQGDEARKYLLKRGIDAATAVKFGLGYSPSDWDALYKYMLDKGFTRDELISAGLCIKGRKDESRTFDFFRGRLMFPVIAANGSVLAFGGRIIVGEDGAKYMNTGDTPIYNKRHNVYAINLMKGKKLDDLIMVEGYMDVISLHQFGIENAVASLGTALTSQQVRLMSRFAKRIIYAYDGDAAGQKAMLRGVDIIKECGVEPRVIGIPGGNDPDEFVRKFGTEAFLELKDNAMTAEQFKLNSILNECDMNSADGRKQFAKRACKLIATLEPVEKTRYIPFISEKSGIAKGVIKEQCGLESANSDGSIQQHESISGAYKRPVFFETTLKTEIMLLACLLKSKHTASQIEQLEGFDHKLFSSDDLKNFALLLKKEYASSKEESVDLKTVLSLNAELATDAVNEAIATADDLLSPVEVASDCINMILNARIDEKIKELSIAADAQTDPKRRNELLKQQMELVLQKRPAN